MADRKLSASTALTGAQVDAANDQFMILDVSDTTDGATGTNKKMTPTEVFEALAYEDAGANLMMYYNFY